MSLYSRLLLLLFCRDFESNVKVGKGVFTLPVGVGPVGGPTVIKIKCFAL